jgi:5'-3' exonuclease
MPQAKAIALVDLSCLFKRTFEANPNAGGQNTLNEIVRIEERVEHLVICLDHPPYKRREIFPAYKANRVEPETAEVFQKNWLREQLRERGYPIARVKGEEADDVIATLARIYGESWPEVWLVGADKDLAQCVTDNVLQLVPKHGERAEYFRGPAEVKEKFEVTPEQIPLFLALVGDKSDNVPGVPGIGPVKAAGLIGEYKTFAGIAEHLAIGTGKMWEALRDNWNQLHLSLKLTTLDSHLPLDAEALLVRKAPKVPETMAPNVELEFDGFMGNATPMPEAALPGPGYSDDPALDDGSDRPEPIIGKDPRADEFLRQLGEQERLRNADRAAQEQQERELARMNTTPAERDKKARPTEAEVDATVERIRRVNEQGSRPPAAVTEAEFIPFGQPGPVPPPPPPPPPRPAAERPDRPGLVKTTPEYGMVTSKLEPEDLRSAEVIAKWLDAGGLYKQKFKSPAAIVTVIMYGKALGLSMMVALSGFHVIEGKPSASADLIRSLAMRSPKCKYFRLVSADDKQATWETWHTDHPESTRLTYTIEEARRAGLKGGNWNTREKQMLVKTCSTILARWVYTVETMGLYCPEEMGDYVDTVGEAA